MADASVVLAGIMHDESESYADAALLEISRKGAAVPGNFHSEVAQGLLQAERRGRITEVHSTTALREILVLPLTVEMPDAAAAMRLARKHHLTCYDAFYLALAVQLDCRLASVDSVLAAAAGALKLHWRPA